MKKIELQLEDNVYESLSKRNHNKDISTEQYIVNLLKKFSSRSYYAKNRINMIDGYNVGRQDIELVKQVMEDYNNGLSTIAIAEKHGIWQKAAWRIVDRNRHKITRWK